MKAVIAIVRPQFVRSLLLAVALLGATFTSSASVFVSVAFAPPPLPVYEQPICPGPQYMWVPGYWAYGPDGYYWVPGTWVLAPFIGALWTPGYWGWDGAVYVWYPGYWGPRVGFYGGIDYGFGYIGVGYYGGYWSGGAFYYNTTVNNVNVNIVRNTYSRTVVENAAASRVSFNGGTGGTTAQPTAEERLAARDRHRAATPLQVQHQRLASTSRSLLASVNHGSPTLAATPRPAAFGQAARTGTAGAASKAPHVASSHPNRELRTERGPSHANAGAPRIQGTTPQGHAPQRAHPQGQPQTHASSQPNRQLRTQQGERHARAGSRTESMPSTQRSQPTREPRIERGERHANAGPSRMEGTPSTPRSQPNREPRIERGERNANAGPPRIEGMPSTPRAQPSREPRIERSEPRANAPRAQSMAPPQGAHPSQEPRIERSERHASAGPAQTQAMPAPQGHAQNAPRPQAQPHETRGGEKRREEGHGQ